MGIVRGTTWVHLGPLELNDKPSLSAEPLHKEKIKKAGVLRRIYYMSSLHEPDVKQSVNPDERVKSHNTFHILTGFATMPVNRLLG